MSKETTKHAVIERGEIALKELDIHPDLKNTHRLAKDSPKFRAMCRGWMRSRRMPALYIDSKNRIVDGRHRYWGAKQLQWETVPYERVADDEVRAIIRETLMNRRHYTLSQLAYLGAENYEAEIAEARQRQISLLKKGDEAPVLHSVQDGATIKEIAGEIGVSERFFRYAIELHTLFENDTKKRTINGEKGVTIRDYFEPRIMREQDPEDSANTKPYGLGAALAGIKQIYDLEKKGGEGDRGGKPKNLDKQLSLFQEGFDTLTKRFTFWSKWNDEAKETAAEAIMPAVEQMPDDLLERFAKTATKELNRRKSAAKGEK